MLLEELELLIKPASPLINPLKWPLPPSKLLPEKSGPLL